MPTSVRLDARTERTLEQLAKNRSQTKSEILRQAIEEMAARQRRPMDVIGDLVGCVHGGPTDLSEETGRRFRELVGRKGR